MTNYTLRHAATHLFALSMLAATLLTSCEKAGNKNFTRSDDFNKELVINEVMASNRTGILAADGNLYDWIEVKNVSDKTISLADYALATVKQPKDKTAKKKKKNKAKNADEATDSDNNENAEEHHIADAKDTKGKKGKKNKKDKKNNADAPVVDSLSSMLLTWNFPEMELAPGKHLIIFASKHPELSTETEPHTDFKISSKNGVLQLIKKDKHIMSEVRYDELEGDQCLRRLDDNTYEKSYMQTPYEENNTKGYETFNEIIDKQRTCPLRIWEVQAKGKKAETWVEVKNVSDAPINLSEYSLSTKPTKAPRWQFPNTTLKPGERYVVDCGKVNFKIRNACCVLLLKEEQFMDGLCSYPAPYGITMGRRNEKLGFFYFASPTRGTANSSTSHRFIADKPEFSELPGIYTDRKSMLLKINTHGYTVHYTLNGSKPTKESPIYKDPIRIDTSCVVRAFCEGDSTSMKSPVATATYIFGREHNIAVMSISVNHADLYDYNRGIYVSGPGGGGPYPHEGANYWKPWWKNAHVEFFDGKEGFQADCGLAIFGGFSRALEKKSFKIKFDDTYGPAKLTYDFFGDGQPMEMKNFVLRSGSQDMGGVMVRDEFFTSLMQPEYSAVLTQKYRPVALYINGSYFGLYYIREKINKRFVARKLHTTDDSISIVMSAKGYCEEGSKTKFTELMNFARNNDLSKKENYKLICNMVDINGVIDQKIGQIYSQNVDVGNIRFVRSDDAASDKKWHIVYYDLDLTWNSDNKPAAFYLNPNDSESGVQNVLVARLLKNSKFRQLFLERLAMHLQKTHSAQNATSVFNNITNTIKQEMKYNCERWPKLLTYTTWEKNVENFKKKIANRNKAMLDDLRKELAITPEENKKYFGDLE